MGLTVHYKLVAPPDTDAVRARELVRQMRRRAMGFKQRRRVDDVLPIGDDGEALRWAEDYRFVPHPWMPGTQSSIDIPAEEGFLVFVEVGEDCEPLRLALCRYPKTVVMGGRRYRTELRGWRFAGFSKTQFASLHGWAHFCRCHTAVIDLVYGMRRLGLKVEINDEGDYWPGRNLAALRRNLDQMNGVVAAAAGAMKDLDAAKGRPSQVQSPIFAHPQFEHLEAEGEQRVRPALQRLREALDPDQPTG
jgi:hypothetical protein